MKLLRLLFTAAASGLCLTCAVAQQKDFHDKDLTEKNFAGANLNGADFSEAVLKGCEFRKATLQKANFKGADISNAGFSDADLTGADLREIVGMAYLQNTILNEANMEGVDMSRSGSVYACKFRGANLRNTKGWGLIGACDFSNADLRGANFRAMQGGPDPRFRNAIYDEDTTWPDNFDPKAAGAKLAKSPSKDESARDRDSESTTKSSKRSGAQSDAEETSGSDKRSSKKKSDDDE
jgi:hypothetical protein